MLGVAAKLAAGSFPFLSETGSQVDFLLSRIPAKKKQGLRKEKEDYFSKFELYFRVYYS